MISRENINSFWASLIVEEMVRNGVELFCISPGSRSTPLTVAAARHPRAECVICHDERGAAFLALGYGKATARPAALVCTSGTAAANYFPAIIEASLDDTPLIVLTADRPPELLHTSANQTIHQENMYGGYTRWDVVLPTPNKEISPQYVLSTVDQAIFRTVATPAGPVHLNCQFREPLAPTPAPFDETYNGRIAQWESSNAPLTSYSTATAGSQKDKIAQIAKDINSCNNGLIILGRAKPSQQHSLEINKLLNTLNWPIHADIASGFRLGGKRENVQRLDKNPDVVLHLGGTFISKNIQQQLEAMPPSRYILIHENAKRIDPGHIVTFRLQGDVTNFASQLAERVERKNKSAHRAQNLDDKVNTKRLSEPLVARFVSKHLPAGHSLFLGNSMPVRHMNEYAVVDGNFHYVGTNRGASGIDGLIASAVGFARGWKAPVTALIGDVSFLHDLNSLNLVRHSKYPITLICINNNGGGIFSRLPIAQHKDIFRTYFTTPHNLTFENAAKMFQLQWSHPRTLEELKESLNAAWTQNKSHIIEARTDPA